MISMWSVFYTYTRNSIISIHSKVMAFLVILLSTWSPHCPCHPHIVPVIPTSSPCHPCCPHIIPIAPRRPPCGPHGCCLCGLCCLHGLNPMLSPWSPCHPRHPHVIFVSSLSSPCGLEGPTSSLTPQIPTPPTPHPPGGWGPQISKNPIRFELIEIF